MGSWTSLFLLVCAECAGMVELWGLSRCKGDYKYEMLNNPGPLAKINGNSASDSVEKVHIDLAVKPQWIDKNGILAGTFLIESVYKLVIPKGTTIYKGPVRYQGEFIWVNRI